GWLKVTFERLLKKKLTQLIDDYQRKTLPREVEYLSFLQATLAIEMKRYIQDKGKSDCRAVTYPGGLFALWAVADATLSS
ncbi:hypothetical protein MJL22_26045, partial [Salmonella enterica subsp. enterica serovar Montevideo]|nr:hypothetical protein [Salmonella enterica subsp. enterica serovar Montevideo]